MKKGKKCISKREQQVGELVMVKCKVVSDAAEGVTDNLQSALERYVSENAYKRSCK
jgi:hypothetical protein